MKIISARSIFYISLLVMGLCLPIASMANADQIDKEITMFIPNTDWPPYLINDPKYPGGGVLLEVFKTAINPMGYSVKAERLPNKRGWYLLDNGLIDVHAKAKQWVPNPDNYLWSEPFMLNEDVLLSSSESPLSFTTPEALHGKRIAAMNGFIYPALEKHFQNGQIERVDVASPYAMLDMIKLGRVDAALVNRNETLWLFKNRPDLQPDKFHLDDTPYDTAEYRYVFTNDAKWKPFIKKFDLRLGEMKKNGRLKAILDQYR